MQSTAYYALLLLILFVTTGWLWRQQRRQSWLLALLYVTTAVTTFLFIWSFTQGDLPEGILLPVQVLLLGGLLASVGVNWRYLLGGVVAVMLLVAFNLLPVSEMLAWALVTAVPFLTVISWQQRRVNIPEFIAQDPALAYLNPVKMDKPVTAEMVLSEEPILECLADGVLVCGSSGLVFSANRSALALLGLDEDELVGRPISQFLVHFPSVEEAEPHTVRTFLLNGRNLQGHMNLIQNAQDETQGAVFVLRDITAEVQARQATDAFLTTISHELRTPLTAVKGYVELMQSSYGAGMDATQRLFMQTIQRNVARMVELVNSLIFAASVKGGRLESRAGYADVPQIMRQITREMQPRAQEQKQQILLQVDEGLGQIEMDPIHLSRIFEELITNSIKYGRPGNIIQVSGMLEADAFAVLSVADEGIGIQPSDQTRIFEAFYRPEYRDEQIRSGGIGMGLSIVRVLVEAYNGRIWFESQPDKGTTFTFILPIHQPQKPTISQLSSEAAPLL